MSNLFANVLLIVEIKALAWSAKATRVAVMPTASGLQLDFWQSGPRVQCSGADTQLVQHKLGSALVELCQLTLAGNLPQKLVFCYQVRSRLLLLFPWEMSVGCIRVTEASGCISGLEIHLQQLVWKWEQTLTYSQDWDRVTQHGLSYPWRSMSCFLHLNASWWKYGFVVS